MSKYVGIQLGIELLGNVVRTCSPLGNATKHFPEGLYTFTVPLAGQGSSGDSCQHQRVFILAILMGAGVLHRGPSFQFLDD